MDPCGMSTGRMETGRMAGSLVSGRLGFVPGLRLALVVCGGAFVLGAVVTRAAPGRDRAHHDPPA